MADMVNHPPHYTRNPFGLETIEITRHYGFSIGNALKYILRAGKKGNDNRGNELGPLDSAAAEVQDLRKAVWYLHDRIKQLQEQFTGWDLDDPYGQRHSDVVVSQVDQTQSEEDDEPRLTVFGGMVDGEEEAIRGFVEHNPGLAQLLSMGRIFTVDFDHVDEQTRGVVTGWDDTPGTGRHRSEK